MFSGKSAMVTGAAKGIGKATALALARQGASVAIVDIQAEGAEQTASEVRQLGVEALAAPTDVADSSQVNSAVERVAAKLGRIDMLVNNAYISGGYAPVPETTDEVWNRVLSVNLTGYFNCARAVSRVMIEQGGGVIVNLSSGAGIRGSISAGVQYSASKAGIIGLTKGLAADLSPHGIRVNCIAPGVIDTDLGAPGTGWTRAELERYGQRDVALGRFGQPEDIADVIVFLLSDASRFMTGEVIAVDGGASLGHRRRKEIPEP
ncbi:MAG: SDR family oxidoreductase [Candidatus Tectomicrobia bacterium]|nr:SDR family oxidoreductase [Candidatus Tectomicrobia bacterium]